MRKARYSDDQIQAAVRQVQEGGSEAQITRQLGISEATFHVWKKRFERATSESTELDRLRYENLELKRLVADLTNHQLCNAMHLRQSCTPAAAVEKTSALADTTTSLQSLTCASSLAEKPGRWEA